MPSSVCRVDDGAGRGAARRAPTWVSLPRAPGPHKTTSAPANPSEPPDTASLDALRTTTGVDLRGYSLGGVETAVYLPSWRLAIDVGRGRRELLRCEHIALTHGHMDHAGGLPYLLALRQLYSMKPPTVYVPAQSAAAVSAMLAGWDGLQRFESKLKLVAAEPGERYPLRRDLELVPFRTYHPVPSLGYTVVRRVDKLDPVYAELPGPEIGRLRREGVAVTREHRQPLLSVTGDTLPEVLDKQPHIADSQVLLIECTFLDHQKPYAAARAGGHVHLDDLLARADALRAPHVVLSHFSQIYSAEEIPALLEPLAARIPGELYCLPQTPGG